MNARLVAALLLAGCARQTPAPPAGEPPAERIGRPIARVGDLPVGIKEFDLEVARQLGRGTNLTAVEKKAVIDQLVAEKLLYQEAVRRRMDLDPRVQKTMVNILLKEHVYAEAREWTPPEDVLRRYYDEHVEDFSIPAKVEVRLLTVAAKEGESLDDARVRAQALREEAMARPDTFDDLVRRHGAGVFAGRGGEVGWITEEGRPGVPDAVVRAALALPAQGFSELFPTDDGWNVVYVPARKDRVQRPYEQMKTSVVRQVKSQRHKDAYQAFVDNLRKDARVWVDDAFLDQHDLSQIDPINPLAGGRRVPLDQARGGDEPDEGTE